MKKIFTELKQYLTPKNNYHEVIDLKKTAVFACLIAIIIFIFPITVKADGNAKFENNNCVVPFELYLTYDGNEKLIKSGYGILVGVDDAGSVSNLIVNAYDAQTTEEDLQTFYSEYSVEEDKRDGVKPLLKVIVEKDIKIEASISNTSNQMNLAVLKLSSQVFNHNSVLFNIDDENIKSAQELYILDNESNYHLGYAVGETSINGINYIQFDSSLDWEQSGQALFNEDEEFLGMIQNSVDGIHKNALSSKEIAVALKTLGVNIYVADHTIKPIDKSVLISATDMAEKLDMSLYTEETANAMKEQIQIARSVIIRDDVTQEEVDEAYANLIQSQDQLVIEKKMDAITLVFIIVSGVLLLTIIIFVIVRLIIRKVKKKKEKEKADIDSKRATVNNGPYVPEANKKAKEKESIASKSEYLTRVKTSLESGRIDESPKSSTLSGKLTSLEGFAPSSKSITINEEDTTVLSVVENKEDEKVKVYSHFEIKESGKRVDVNKEIFVIGKSQDADYTIDNKSVSRRHLSIVHKEDKNYVKDMSSLNGSFVNGEKISPETEVEIKDNDSIKLADVEIVFHIE